MGCGVLNLNAYRVLTLATTFAALLLRRSHVFDIFCVAGCMYRSSVQRRGSTEGMEDYDARCFYRLGRHFFNDYLLLRLAYVSSARRPENL